jgi:DNA-binding transcriptional MerR regulator
MKGFTTAQLANEGGVNVETIRYCYERHGLLPKPPRTPTGYRVFSELRVCLLGTAISVLDERCKFQVSGDRSEGIE